MARVIGGLLYAIARSLIEDQVNSFFRQISQKVLSWLDTKFKGRAATVVGLLVGLAAAGFFPMIALLLAH
jgi:hypothetical protein